MSESTSMLPATIPAVKLIPLTQGKFATVDATDYVWLSRWKWYADKAKRTFYATRNEFSNKRKITIRMHSFIMAGEMADHIDGNGLNNSRRNLRVATHSQNNANSRPRNTSRFKGVSWNKRLRKWHGYINPCNQKRRHLGFFDTAEEAALAYDSAAIKFFGEFALTNKQLGLL